MTNISRVEKPLENGHGMLLLLNQEPEGVELDVIRKYQYFMSLIGNQAARSMFLEEYLVLQELSIPPGAPRKVRDGWTQAVLESETSGLGS